MHDKNEFRKIKLMWKNVLGRYSVNHAGSGSG
jgi:hypothetical protein